MNGMDPDDKRAISYWVDFSDSPATDPHPEKDSSDSPSRKTLIAVGSAGILALAGAVYLTQ